MQGPPRDGDVAHYNYFNSTYHPVANPPNPVNYNSELALTTGNLQDRRGNYRFPHYEEVNFKPDFAATGDVNYWMQHFIQGTSCAPELHSAGANFSPLKNHYLRNLRTITVGDYQEYNDLSPTWVYIVLAESEYMELRQHPPLVLHPLQLPLRPLRRHQLLLLGGQARRSGGLPRERRQYREALRAGHPPGVLLQFPLPGLQQQLQ